MIDGIISKKWDELVEDVATELKQIKDFIANHEICVLATCANRQPRASTVNYVADGFTLYIITASASRKVANIRENPRVSVAIDDQGKTRFCLQAEGTAEILSGEEAKVIRERYFRNSHHPPELIDTILRIRLKEFMFTDYSDKPKVKIYKLKTTSTGA